MPRGTSVGGPQRITRAPSLVRPQMFDRATREWLMSPTRPTVRPSIRPLARRIVSRSSRPCVGCSWAPSPALMIDALTCWASRCGAPGVGWRTTITSAPIASMFLAVSMNVSPLERLETLAEKSCTSAESRLAARLKLVRVRVEFSKKRLKTIRPWSAGTFLRLRVEISANDSAVSRMRDDLLARTGLRGRAGACGSRPAGRCAGRVGGDSAVGSRSRPCGVRPGDVRGRLASGSGAPATRTISSTGSTGRDPDARRARRGRSATVRPTTSGWIGSSRWPRSTRTARRTRAGRPRSQTAFRAARTVRPVNRTSSTRTISAPSTSKGISVPCRTGQRSPWPRSSR